MLQHCKIYCSNNLYFAKNNQILLMELFHKNAIEALDFVFTYVKYKINYFEVNLLK